MADSLTPSSHPCPAVPLSHQPHMTPLANIRPRLLLAVDRLPCLADGASPEVDFHLLKCPGGRGSRERLHLRRPFCLIQAVVAEVLPHRPTTPTTSAAARKRGHGIVLCRRTFFQDADIHGSAIIVTVEEPVGQMDR